MIWGITVRRGMNPPHLFPTVWAAIRHTRKIYEANNASRMFLLNNNKPYPYNQIVLVTYENDPRFRNRNRFMATERVVSKTEAFKATIIKMQMHGRMGRNNFFGNFATCLHIEQGSNTTSMAFSYNGGYSLKKINAVIGKFHSGQFEVMKPDSCTAGLELISDAMLPPLRAEAMPRTNKRYQFEHTRLSNLTKQFVYGFETMRFPKFYSTMGPVEAACALSRGPEEVDPLSETFVAVREGQKLFKPVRGLINPRILIEHNLSWSLQSHPLPEVGFPTEEDATLYSVVAPIGFDAP